MSRAIVCIAESQEQAQAILNELMSAGFSRKDISVIDVSEFVADKMVTADRRSQRRRTIVGARLSRASKRILVPTGNGKEKLLK